MSVKSFMSKMRNLAAFDFDHTIIELNSDAVIASTVQGGVPESVKNLHRNNGWTAYMQKIFELLNMEGYSEDFIRNTIIKLNPVCGMIDLIEELSSKFNYDVIIISDSNSYFIDAWLNNYDLKKCVLRVFTNPAQFKDNLLMIEPYHLQDYCDLSSKNLCKGQILQDFVAEQEKNGVLYDRIIYAGDGANDLCPILRLKIGDHAFVRNGFKLADIVKKVVNGDMKDKSENLYEIKAKIHYWTDALNILEKVRNIHDEINDS
ncbi:probable phosphatase phospho2 [Harmonia axyridis]|uniref:probable phosphatase phospho2 n=1 Tax=Harmonia axyridis TaxID=115357 RepID=UPI001E279638|nr:probable phosphatase phospho2 [Harmonia axyridis]